MSQVPLPALATAASATDSPSGTQLSLSATLDFNGQPVNIATGDLRSGKITLVFSLTNPVVIGNLEGFIKWAGAQFGVNIDTEDIKKVINDIPIEWLKNAANSVVTANLTITILNVSIQPDKPNYVQVAASLAFDPPIGPSWLNLTSLGFMVTHGQEPAA